MKGTRYSVKVFSLRVQEAGPPQGQVNSSEEAKQILRAYFETVRDDRERFVALALSSKNALIGIAEVSVGGASASLVDPKVLFRTLLVRGATRFILAHNHPSGDPTPSREDLTLTRQLREGGRLLELECLDHLVDRKSTRLNSSHSRASRMPSSA